MVGPGEAVPVLLLQRPMCSQEPLCHQRGNLGVLGISLGISLGLGDVSLCLECGLALGGPFGREAVTFLPGIITEVVRAPDLVETYSDM